jgi:Ca2+-binding EF-hand superfamily protein
MNKNEVKTTEKTRIFTDEEIRNAFQTFDLDKNMYIGPSEIKHILSLVGERATNEEIDEMIRMCDPDGSGLVSFDGFRKLFAASPSNVADVPPGGSSSDHPRYERAQTTKAINMGDLLADYSKSQEITPQFIRSVYKRFQEVDKTRSGRIGYPEFVQVMKTEDGTFSRNLFDVFDVSLMNEIDVKTFLVNLIIHSNSIKMEEKLKIAFSMMRSNNSPNNSMDRGSLHDLLTTFFAGYPSSGAKIAVDTRVDEIFKSARGEFLSINDFLDVVEVNPEMVLSPPLLLKA